MASTARIPKSRRVQHRLYTKAEVDGLIAALLGILQPLLIVAMGAIVLTIVLAILLPIFEINNLIR